MRMLEPVEVSSQPWICSYGQAPSHCGYALSRTSYDGYAPMDMPLPTVDMPLPGPSMTDMLLWICSFPLWICPGQDTVPWICSFQLWICSCQVDTLSWICSSQLWICFYQDPAWWICAYGYAPPTYGYVPARIIFGGQAPMDLLFSFL